MNSGSSAGDVAPLLAALCSSKVSAEQIFYMMQRGLSEGEAMSLAVNGFVNELMKAFPMEYSVELKRLIDMEMEGSVG